MSNYLEAQLRSVGSHHLLAQSVSTGHSRRCLLALPLDLWYTTTYWLCHISNHLLDGPDLL